MFATSRSGDRAFKDVGVADEFRCKPARRAIIEISRRSGLDHLPVFHQNDPVAHQHRFGLVVRDVKRSLAQPSL